MKNCVRIAVLTVIVAVSTATAQDTVKIVSLRTIDVCTNDKRWLVAVSLGRINFSDSLQSFDITIGFNRDILRPTDALKEGTLAGQMSIGPLVSLTTPGEMRVSGFNTVRSVGGDLPLIGVAGEFLGTCSDIGALTLPYPIDFNGEFKRKFDVAVIESVQPVAVAKNESTKGIRFLETSAAIDDTLDSTTLTAEVIGEIRDGGMAITLSVEGEWDSLATFQPTVRVENANLIEVRKELRSITVSLTSDPKTALQPQVHYDFLRRSTASAGKFNVMVFSRNSDLCACFQPTIKDTALIEVKKSIVSSCKSDDDAVCTIDVHEGYIIGKCYHDRIQSIDVKDVAGRSIITAAPVASTGFISIEDFPHGVFLATMTCGNGTTQKTIVK